MLNKCEQNRKNWGKKVYIGKYFWKKKKCKGMQEWLENRQKITREQKMNQIIKRKGNGYDEINSMDSKRWKRPKYNVKIL